MAQKALKALGEYIFSCIGERPIDEVRPKDLVMVLRFIKEQGTADICLAEWW
ncbi:MULTISPECIES: phage integrase central domain-containing protein [unclassified Acinetobacter]|uniref:phage integrase central domain-containing protein n=1 Tax=unclassified Acinetobacter TaxID=196816 RepID=UPI002934997D|nr:MULTISPECIES: hypothetical protein [unclassified Acinetobacter]WOE31679.1 hypothetical protein QSG84_00120 [Acinetobacter sp. SAAs470]WOE37144.1 hypothetical protein QSG86_09165 [Acinetobacter sp. SAAs474]